MQNLATVDQRATAAASQRQQVLAEAAKQAKDVAALRTELAETHTIGVVKDTASK